MNQLPQSDPKLKDAADEIDVICQKYGIAAFYALASSTHAEFKILFPPWSLVQPNQEGFTIRMKKGEHSIDQVAASCHLAYSLRDMAGLQFQNFEAVCQTLTRELNVEHKPFHGIWGLDGWQKPNLGAAPADIVDLHKRRKPKKGFGNKRQ